MYVYIYVYVFLFFDFNIVTPLTLFFFFFLSWLLNVYPPVHFWKACKECMSLHIFFSPSG